MSRTFKDKPYRVLEREALEHGYTYLRHNWMHPTEPPTVEGDVAAYSYSRGRKEHIPSGHRWHSWHDYEDDWYPDYVGRHTVRDRVRPVPSPRQVGMLTKGGFSDRFVFVPAVAGCQGRVRPFRFVHSIMERRAREIHCRGRGFGLVGRHQPRL